MSTDRITAKTEQILLDKYDSYYRLAYSYVRNQEDALDIVQESAYRAIRDCHKVKDSRFLSTWIYRIVVNAALDVLRKKAREDTTPDFPDIPYADQYQEMDLRRLLEVLDEKSRTVVILRYFEDMKLEEIAQVMEENVNTVKARLYRTLKKLRLELEPDRKGALL